MAAEQRAYAVRHFALLLRLQYRAKSAYRADLALQIVSALLRQGTWLAFMLVLLRRTPAVEGWTTWKMIFLYGLATAPLGLNVLLFDGVWKLVELIRKGELDALLLRPVDPVLHLYTRNVSLHGLGDLAVGCVAMGLAAGHLDLSMWTLPVLLMCVACGSVIYGSVNLASASLAFWFREVNNVPFLVQQFTDLARFPLHLYPRLLSAAFFFPLPFAFVTYLPVTALTGDTSLWVLPAAPVAAVLLHLLARSVFHRGLRRYESAGN
ncbi:ABC-2 family transporter protein [Streptomyces niveiscabiei]|uniref:ABC transporter permease n=1 Tax=Streptomyces niveiscabiei TaxID=164115 RepID=UPI0029A18C50|nr:ABC-2 family transporter protein [Streptomyces niveiscabiei]MDX3388026.1 ABC-2 family transporter protein [Streptomyces niveiscabiei]